MRSGSGERPRPRRWPRFVTVVLIAGIMALTAWIAGQPLRARSAAQQLQQNLEQFTGNVGSFDTAAMAAQLPDIRDNAADLQAAVSAAPLAWTAALPLVGDGVTGAGSLAEAVSVTAGEPAPPSHCSPCSAHRGCGRRTALWM